MASAYLQNTTTTATDTKKFTWSFWFKRSGLGSTQRFINIFQDGDNKVNSEFGSDDRFYYFDKRSASTVFNIETLQKFRDTSAWYHMVIAVDTTQATQSDRVKVYVNGTLADLNTLTAPALNAETGTQVVTATNQRRIGTTNTASTFYDGSITHMHFTDGYTYQASTFGETDSTSGIWKPKTSPSVTYGTNGFFLKMENSSDFGEDSSGNNNDFTTSGTITQTEDTPSNVFATMNPLAMGTASSGLTFSNGNLTSTNSSTSHRSVISTLAVSTGKWYYEGKSVTTGGAYPTFGIFNIDASFDAGTFFTSTANGYGYNSNGHIYHNNGSLITGLSTWTDGDIIGIALDATNNKLYISKNGVWQNSGDPSAGTGGISITSDITWCFAAHLNDAGTDPVQNYNFGNGYFGTTAVASSNSDGDGLGLFEYTVPSGYYALCTKNIKNYG